MKTVANLSSAPSSLRQSYGYPGGTLHLVPWVDVFAGLTLIWLVYFVGGASAIRTAHGIFFCGFGFFWIFLGVYWEWTLRNQPGRITVDKDGLTCTLPWKRQRSFRWDEIREVRCLGRRFHPGVSFWEIQGVTPQENIVITWELKGFEELLRSIRARATNCQRFDPID